MLLVSIEVNRTGELFLMFFGFKVFTKVLRTLGYYVLRYEGQGFMSARKMPATIPPHLV